MKNVKLLNEGTGKKFVDAPRMAGLICDFKKNVAVKWCVINLELL